MMKNVVYEKLILLAEELEVMGASAFRLKEKCTELVT
jgi:hypothetical protein